MIAVVVVMIAVVVVVILADHEITIDGLACLVDDLDVLEQPVERLVLAHLGDEVGDGIVALVGLANLAGLLANLQRDAGVLGVDVVVGDFEPSATPTARRARSTLTAFSDCTFEALDERRRDPDR